MSNIKYQIAGKLVWLANRLVKSGGVTSPTQWPYYRPVDTYIPGIGHKYSCGAYSYEHLKSLTEQDGSDGFGATCTIKWLISEEGWKDVADMDPKELRREFAICGIDLEDSDEEQ